MTESFRMRIKVMAKMRMQEIELLHAVADAARIIAGQTQHSPPFGMTQMEKALAALDDFEVNKENLAQVMMEELENEASAEMLGILKEK